jgi:hypothetical protein
MGKEGNLLAEAQAAGKTKGLPVDMSGGKSFFPSPQTVPKVRRFNLN